MKPREFWVTEESFNVMWINERSGHQLAHGALPIDPETLGDEKPYIRVIELSAYTALEAKLEKAIDYLREECCCTGESCYDGEFVTCHVCDAITELETK